MQIVLPILLYEFFCQRQFSSSYKLSGPAVSWVKKVGGTESCNFPTANIMGAQNFNFASKFPKNNDGDL